MIVYDKDLFVEQPLYLYQKGDFKRNGSIMIGYTSYEQLSLAEEEQTSSQINALKNGDYASFKTITQNRLYVDNQQFNRVLKFYLNTSQLNKKKVDYFYYYVNIITDYEYRCPSNFLAEYLSKLNTNIYAYLYAHKSSTSEYPAKYDGAAHAEEIEFMFGKPLFDSDNYKSDEKLFSEKLIDYWIDFSKNGKPSLNNEWFKYTETNSLTS